jgi:hypothetical protein
MPATMKQQKKIFREQPKPLTKKDSHREKEW